MTASPPLEPTTGAFERIGAAVAHPPASAKAALAMMTQSLANEPGPAMRFTGAAT